MNFNISSILQYSSWLIKKYSEQHAISQTIYRIVDINKLPSDRYQLSIQVIGKSIFIECDPLELATNDRMLEGFSKKDIRSIIYLACETKKRPSYKIIVQEFCEKLSNIIFKIKKIDGNEVFAKTAGEIFLDKNLLASLSQKDICSVIYAAGYEQSLCKN